VIRISGAALFALLLWTTLASAQGTQICFQAPSGINCQAVNALNPLPVAGSTGAPYAYTPLTPSQNGLGVASATALTIPTGATYAVVCSETQGVRWTWDGTTTPTASVGTPLAAGQCAAFSGAGVLANLKFIQQTATATIDVEYAK